MDKHCKVHPSEKAKAVFAHNINDRLQKFKFAQLLKLPVVINKLSLDDVPLKDAEGNEVALTSKVVSEIKSRPGDEKTQDGTFTTSTRSMNVLLENLIKDSVKDDGTINLA